MRKFLTGNTDAIKRKLTASKRTRMVPDFIVLFMFLGVISGGIVGSFLDQTVSGGKFVFDCADLSFQTLFRVFWNYGSVFVFLLFCASSYLGFIPIPLLLFKKCYDFAFDVSSAYSSFAWDGLLKSFLSVGIPMLVSLPVLLIATKECFLASRQMFQLRFEIPFVPTRKRRFVLFLTTICVVLFDTFYTLYLIPIFLS